MNGKILKAILILSLANGMGDFHGETTTEEKILFVKNSIDVPRLLLS